MFPQEIEKKNITVVVIPGLTGGSNKGYVKGLVWYLTKQRGFTTVVVNPRGVADTELTSPKLTDLNDYSDFLIAMQEVKLRTGEACVGTGLSMGGNILLKMAGDMKQDFPLQACIVFNSPLDLWKCI